MGGLFAPSAAASGSMVFELAVGIARGFRARSEADHLNDLFLILIIAQEHYQV